MVDSDQESWRGHLAAIAAHGGRRHLRAGQHLLRQGDPPDELTIIESGFVRVTQIAPDGTESILAVRGPGAVCGEMGIILDEPRSADVVALVDVTATRVTADRFLAHLTNHPDAALAILRVVLRRQLEADANIVSLRTHSLEQRIALRLLHTSPEATASHDIYLSQHELGQYVAASRSEVNRALTRLREAGVVETGRGRLTVFPDALRRLLSEAPAPALAI